MSDLQPNKFRFSVIIRDVITQILDNSPDGWLKTQITYKGDSFYKGVRRSLTIPYKYVKQSATTLRREFYTYSVLGKAVLKLEKLIPKTWLYETLYTGKINFSTAKDGQTGITIDSSTNDFTIQVDAYDKKKFIFPLEGADVLDITLPSLALKENCDFIMLSSNDLRSDAFFAIQVVNYQQNATRSSVKDAGFLAQSGPVFSEVEQWFFRPTIATKVRIYGKMSFIVATPFLSNIRYQINFYNSAGDILKTVFDETISDPVARDIAFDFVLNIPAGDYVSLYFKNVTNDNTNTGFRMISGTVSLEYNTASPESKCKGIRAYDLYLRLLRAMNIVNVTGVNPPVPAQSYLLNKALPGNVFGNLVYTCSDSIRAGNAMNTYVGTIYQAGDTLQANGRYLVLGSFIVYNGIHYDAGTYFNFMLGQNTFNSPDNEGFVKQTASTPSIVMSFREDFFQDMRALQFGQVAFGIENGVAYLEDLPYCFRPGSGSLDVGTVDTTTEISAATDLMYNSFKGGYKNQQYDKINGLLEVNSEVRYVSDLVDPNEELDVQASSRADPYGIEITRVVGVDSASSRSDNDNFMIMVKDAAELDGSFKPSQMDKLAAFSGVDESYYNWFITPKQNFNRGKRYLRSIFDKMDGYSIRVSAPLKNVNLVTVNASGKRVAEGEEEVISDSFGPRIFIPWYIDIKAGLPLGASDIIDLALFSDISCTWNDTVIKGFASGGGEINIDEGENSAQKFKLLLTPENKTLDLVR